MRITVVVLALSLAACQGGREKKAEAPTAAPKADVEAANSMASIVHTRDPKSVTQLASGFYDIEQNAWRWTAKSFSVVLHPPAGSTQKGATLEMEVTVPPQVTQRVGAVTLTASVEGKTLPPETWSQPGQYVFKRDVPGALLAADPARVDFQLDKAMPPSGKDLRELGIVVLSVGLMPK